MVNPDPRGVSRASSAHTWCSGCPGVSSPLLGINFHLPMSLQSAWGSHSLWSPSTPRDPASMDPGHHVTSFLGKENHQDLSGLKGLGAVTSPLPGWEDRSPQDSSEATLLTFVVALLCSFVPMVISANPTLFLVDTLN